jgi:hypothetical protein
LNESIPDRLHVNGRQETRSSEVSASVDDMKNWQVLVVHYIQKNLLVEGELAVHPHREREWADRYCLTCPARLRDLVDKLPGFLIHVLGLSFAQCVVKFCGARVGKVPVEPLNLSSGVKSMRFVR